MLRRAGERLTGFVAKMREERESAAEEHKPTSIRARMENGVLVIRSSAKIKKKDLRGGNLLVITCDHGAEITFGNEPGYRKLQPGERVIVKYASGIDKMFAGYTASGEYFKVVGSELRTLKLSLFDIRIET